VTLRFYDAPSDGSEVWQEQHTITLARSDSGVFSVVLGSRQPFGTDISFNEPLWLTIQVDGGEEFSPRQLLSSVSYAINADTLDGLVSAAFVRAGTSVDAAGELVSDSVGAAALSAAAIQPGDIEVGDLPAPYNTTTGPAHTHDVEPPGSRVSQTASDTAPLSTSSDTELLSATITKSRASSALLVLATVQIRSTGTVSGKMAEVKLFRDGTQLDQTYKVFLAPAGGPPVDNTVTLHAWDAPGAGTYTVALRARADSAGVQAGTRRLTILELP
jgi:hypothetical protein